MMKPAMVERREFDLTIQEKRQSRQSIVRQRDHSASHRDTLVQRPERETDRPYRKIVRCIDSERERGSGVTLRWRETLDHSVSHRDYIVRWTERETEWPGRVIDRHADTKTRWRKASRVESRSVEVVRSLCLELEARSHGVSCHTGPIRQ